eukprot:scaffold125022_cov60-Phaeocystis_antarctica.AAC.2
MKIPQVPRGYKALTLDPTSETEAILPSNVCSIVLSSESGTAIIKVASSVLVSEAAAFAPRGGRVRAAPRHELVQRPRGTASSVDHALRLLPDLALGLGLPDVGRGPGARPAGDIMLLRPPPVAGRAGRSPCSSFVGALSSPAERAASPPDPPRPAPAAAAGARAPPALACAPAPGAPPPAWPRRSGTAPPRHASFASHHRGSVAWTLPRRRVGGAPCRAPRGLLAAVPRTG